jgi:hypothetical protein
MTFYFDENGRNQLKWTETSASGGPLKLILAIYGPIVFDPFEYLAQNDSAKRSTTLYQTQKITDQHSAILTKPIFG